jgi:prevent-host-death family protein
MHILAASDAKNLFGKMLDMAQRESVMIEKKGRAVAVIMSIQEYHRFEELENTLWGQKAYDAEKEGFVGTKQSDDILRNLL